jgi:hypothetical protein
MLILTGNALRFQKSAVLVFASLLLHYCFVNVVDCWNQWDYKVTYSPDNIQASNLKAQWELNWARSHYYGNGSAPPRPRRGHSLHLIKTDPRSVYDGATYVVMFGGRDNDQVTKHIPKTYNVDLRNGQIVFTTYDDKPVSPCNDLHHEYYTLEETAGCNYNETAFIDVGFIYNDVWAYKLCNQTGIGVNPDRDFDSPCNSTGWELWHAGALQGGW